ncbi:MAG: alternative ribosome rescue aminoacyl-tRNA hydrolase ArfB [Candidatus Poribacteria bacterium]|nr:alternative ribosome rescue aminoacyl-tRNA hydrolase ArfB [Candidatus Poribacteria bacterium]MDE0502747.1 alternative ribosome rescue aminoacyl-tRNA hydrolase ArfB [Candidatus Poribacteria bacterium]
MIQITEDIAINESDIQVKFVRSAGPGGQNVNKVSTAAQLRFDAKHAALPDNVRDRLIRLAGKKMTAQGELLITASRFRTQDRNRQDALDKLVALIRRAAVPPKSRKPTVPTRASNDRRLKSKRHRGELKQIRKSNPLDEIS